MIPAPMPVSTPAPQISSRSSLGRRVVPLVVLLAVLVAPAAGASEPAEGDLERLREDVAALIANIWDQKMARQMEMDLDLPASEVEARLEILGRWAEALAAGSLGAPVELPAGFTERHREQVGAVERALAGETVDLSPVVRYLEEAVDELQKLAGTSAAPPTARGPSR